ncbi:MAG: hypothetical protein KF678_12565 [Phycisphaeraceae bacterium]|nr:hypothetical protein [Phycisphaeraceae bacterium]
MTTLQRMAALGLLVAAGLPAAAQTVDDGRAVSNELFSDASWRTAGLGAPEKVYAPKVGGQVISRYNVNYRNNPPGFSDTTLGGQMAQVKLNFTGNVVDESIRYRIQFKFDETNGNLVLEDSFIDVQPEDEFVFRFGQFKAPLLKEELMSDVRQLTANRSVMNAVFSQGRTQGAMLIYTAPTQRVSFAATDGLRTPNTDYVAPSEADFALTGRYEYKIDGDWKQYEEFTSFPDSKYFGALGAALHYQEGGDSFATGVGRTDNINIWQATVDAMAKGNGWNVYTAAVFRQRETVAATRVSRDDFGFLIQGGYFFRPQWELFARYDVVIPDGRRTLDRTFNTITIGANKYISPRSHALKFTVDVQWFLDRQNAQDLVTENTSTGVLRSTDDNQLALRAQLQLVF